MSVIVKALDGTELMLVLLLEVTSRCCVYHDRREWIERDMTATLAQPHGKGPAV